MTGTRATTIALQAGIKAARLAGETPHEIADRLQLSRARVYQLQPAREPAY
jgi:hypothetical protein